MSHDYTSADHDELWLRQHLPDVTDEELDQFIGDVAMLCATQAVPENVARGESLDRIQLRRFRLNNR
jgi:hypothetical protein